MDLQALVSNTKASSTTSRSMLPDAVSSADVTDAQPSALMESPKDRVVEVLICGNTDTDYQPSSGAEDWASVATPQSQVLPWRVAVASTVGEMAREEPRIADSDKDRPLRKTSGVSAMTNLPDLPNEVLLQIFGYLDVNDLLSTSRVSRMLLRAVF